MITLRGSQHHVLLMSCIICSYQKIKIAALRMYTCCVERVNYDQFFDSE